MHALHYRERRTKVEGKSNHGRDKSSSERADEIGDIAQEPDAEERE